MNYNYHQQGKKSLKHSNEPNILVVTDSCQVGLKAHSTEEKSCLVLKTRQMYGISKVIDLRRESTIATLHIICNYFLKCIPTQKCGCCPSSTKLLLRANGEHFRNLQADIMQKSIIHIKYICNRTPASKAQETSQKREQKNWKSQKTWKLAVRLCLL